MDPPNTIIPVNVTVIFLGVDNPLDNPVGLSHAWKLDFK